MKITYDSEANATYVKLNNRKIHHTEEYGKYYVDVDRKGDIVGIEYLNSPEFKLDGMQLSMQLIKSEMLESD